MAPITASDQTTPPAAGTSRTKKWWMIHVAAGVVMVALVAIGVTQCSAKKEERADKEAKESALTKANADAADAAELKKKMDAQIKGLRSDNSERARTNKMLCDSIVKLNNSLLIVNEELTDCRNSKRKPAKSAQPVKTQPKPAVAKPECGSNVNVNLNNAQNNGAIVVGNGNNVVVNTPAVQAAVDTLNKVTVKRTIRIKCTVEREY